MEPIYLDHAATTPVDPSVLDAMLPYFGETYGNPSSLHAFGQSAKQALEEAGPVNMEETIDYEELMKLVNSALVRGDG